MLPLHSEHGWLHFWAALTMGLVAGFSLIRLFEFSS